jgi:hypothetical protein
VPPPGLAFLPIVALVVRQGRGQKLQADPRQPQRLSRQAERHEVDEGALAAPRIAQEHQPFLSVELGERGEPLLTISEKIPAQPARTALRLLRSEGQKAGVDRLQLKAGLPVPRRERRVDSAESEKARLLHQPGEIGLPQRGAIRAGGRRIPVEVPAGSRSALAGRHVARTLGQRSVALEPPPRRAGFLRRLGGGFLLESRVLCLKPRNLRHRPRQLRAFPHLRRTASLCHDPSFPTPPVGANRPGRRFHGSRSLETATGTPRPRGRRGPRLGSPRRVFS